MLWFQKEMFLIVKEICPELDSELDFKRYRHGPFSKNLVDILYGLERDSLININMYDEYCSYSITSEGVEKLSKLEIPGEVMRKIENLKKGSTRLGYKGLIRYIYFNYPEYIMWIEEDIEVFYKGVKN